MKRTVLIIFALLLTVCVNAQREEGDVTIQPRVGLNLSTMNDYNKTKPGYVFGMEMEYQMTDMLSLSAALMYSDQGAKDDEDGIEEVLDIDFVNLPIMLNCYVLPGLALKAGVQPAFRTKTTVRFDGKKYDVDWLLERAGYGDSKMSKVMFSIPVGLSYEYRNFVLDARYNIGVTDFLKGEGTMRNHVFQLTLGYKFDIQL